MKTKTSKSKKLSKAKADKWFSLYIRERDKDKPCCTCGKRTKFKDCGHFISRAYESVRYDEKNSHGQCQLCNRFKSGQQFQHSLHVDKIYGSGTAENLLIKSKMLCKRNQFDYEMIAQEFKEKYEELLHLANIS